MQPQTTTLPTSTGIHLSLNEFVLRVFAWMAGGLLLTGAVAFLIANNFGLMLFFYRNPWILIVTIFVELGLVFAISGLVNRLSAVTAGILFTIYSLVNGIFLSAIFITYDPQTIAIAFGATALTFSAMAVYGYTTKSDLTGWGSLAIMGLIGVIIGGIINIFTRSDALGWILTYVALAIFIILTAYDVQKLKQYHAAAEQTGKGGSLAVSAALALYLDFINLLLLILRILGKGRN